MTIMDEVGLSADRLTDCEGVSRNLSEQKKCPLELTAGAQTDTPVPPQDLSQSQKLCMNPGSRCEHTHGDVTTARMSSFWRLTQADG